MSKALLLVCPTCQARGDKTILGALMPEGNFVIRRWFKDQGNKEMSITFIEQMTVICQCGFGTTLKNDAHNHLDPHISI